MVKLTEMGFDQREVKQFHRNFYIVWVGYKQVVIIDRLTDIASLIETTTSNGEQDYSKALERCISINNLG